MRVSPRRNRFQDCKPAAPRQGGEWPGPLRLRVAERPRFVVSFGMSSIAPPSVSVRVLLFASYADGLGLDTLELILPARSTVGAVVEHLRRLPGGQLLPPKPLCARNLAHATPDEPVQDGDEIAVLPPLAGG